MEPVPAAVRRTRGAKTDYIPDDPLLNAREAAAETGRARSTFLRDVRRRRLPQAIYILPRMPRWKRSELRAAVEACRTAVKGPA